MSEQFKSIETTELVKIANAIRTKTGITDKISLEDMPAKIAAIESGVTLPELENEGSDSDLMEGKELIDNEGNKVTGTMPTAAQAIPSITVNSSGLITATATQTAGYVSAGTESATKQLAFQAAKTITPSTTSQIAVSSGYYTGGNITVAAVPTQSKTVTPTSTTQNITPDSGKFLSKVTVSGDSDLVAGNIKSGVNIFGVTGTYAGSGGFGGDTSVEDSLIDGTCSVYTNDRVISIGNYIFYSCSRLTSVSFPVATSIGSYAFCSCSRLTSVSFPKVTSIGSYAFGYCSSLTSVRFPKITSIDSHAFFCCYRLTSVSFPVATSIGRYAFTNCYNLKSLYLTGSSLCKLFNSNAFSSTPVGGYSKSARTYGNIYVPASLLTAYKTATNWTYFSSRFVGI